MSFLDESDFKDNSHENNKWNKNIDLEDEDDGLGLAQNGSRARMLAQEREKQMKRRQNSAATEGFI